MMPPGLSFNYVTRVVIRGTTIAIPQLRLSSSFSKYNHHKLNKQCLQSLSTLRNSRYFMQGNRPLSTSPVLRADGEMVDVTFVTNDGQRHKTKGKVGDNLLDVVVNNNVDLDGFGACEGTLACSTCHLVFKKEDFDKIKDAVTDEELDMLDLAYGLTDTSRLGCQVTLTKELAGVEVEVPAGVIDQRS